MATIIPLMRHVGRWVGLALAIGLAAGLASALFLVSLAWVTQLQTTNWWLLLCLPLLGGLVAWLYQRFGQRVAAGNNLIIEQLHNPDAAGIPLRMAPLVLLGTLLTHLGGGSAGREGTAVQMGASLAAQLGRCWRLPQAELRLVLMMGMSAGFGSVFGTPIAGTIFALEVLAFGVLRYEAVLPCLAAALVGDGVVRWLNIVHSHYQVASVPDLGSIWAWLLGAGICFGLVSRAFVIWIELVQSRSRRWLPNPILRAMLGGLVIVIISFLLNTRDYNGLSLPLLAQAFELQGVVPWAFAIKLLLTGLTLGVGFKGGEVTPLFVIGATLGSALAQLFGLPSDLLAALGLIAVFAGAANTPIACVLMGIELFGSALLVPLMLTTVIAYTISGHRGIYAAQRVGWAKRHNLAEHTGKRLDELEAD
ncbi:chloride channel protein [Herpetosiphon sp. NSE202]|uniref:chloride channel protein n=1 Tax=Herpetosiphon sp. NSE202 TaxID=3351349 RepID=UPI003629E1D3